MRRSFALLAAPLALVACTFVQSLDYLSNGGAVQEEGGLPDGGSEAAADGGVVPEVVAGGQSVPDRVTLDATDVYWHATGGILAVAKTGGTPRVIAATATDINALIVDPGTAGHVYWSIDTDIFRAPKQGGDGGAGERVFSGSSTLVGFAVDDAFLYVALPVGSPEGAIIRIPKGGGQPTVIDAVDDPLALAVDSTTIVWVDADASAARLLPKTQVADGGTEGGAGGVLVGNKGTDPIAPWSDDVFVLAPDAFFWSETGGNSTFVFRHARTGSARTTLWAGSASAEVVGLSVDDRFVWLTETTTKSLFRVPREGGEPVAVSSAPGIGGVASDGTNVYFASQAANPNDGAILRIPAR